MSPWVLGSAVGYDDFDFFDKKEPPRNGYKWDSRTHAFQNMFFNFFSRFVSVWLLAIFKHFDVGIIIRQIR
jgi:hypothetical protein